MAFGRKDEKRSEENLARTNAATEWRKDGNKVLVYEVKAPATWNGGILEDASQEIGAIEQGGWHLDHMAWSNGAMVMFVFHTEG